MLDGLEITQFTYFQQVGGIDLSPVSAEITYGLERIAMFLQKVDNVYDLRVGARRDVPARSGCATRSSSRSTRSARSTCRASAFVALHRDLFDKLLRVLRASCFESGLVLPALEHA